MKENIIGQKREILTRTILLILFVISLFTITSCSKKSIPESLCTVSFDPQPTDGPFMVGVLKVSMSCDISDAIIYYTVDGSDPNADSLQYTDYILIGKSTTIKAIAIKDDKKSQIATADYVIVQLPSQPYDQNNNNNNPVVPFNNTNTSGNGSNPPITYSGGGGGGGGGHGGGGGGSGDENSLPTVEITHPLNNQFFSIGQVVSIDADATDTDGSINAVYFYVNSVLIYNDSISPYSTSFSISEGEYSLEAKAVDNDGAESWSPEIIISGVAGNAPPYIEITAPLDGSSYVQDQQILISANAIDDVQITRVDFYIDGVNVNSVSSSPFEYLWISQSVGAHEIYAIAYDNEGVFTQSNSVDVNIYVLNAPPNIYITNPLNGTVYTTEGDIAFTATAYDDDGISSVEFSYEGGLFSNDTTYPYEYIWRGITPGTHVITAKAFDTTGLSNFKDVYVTYIPGAINDTNSTNNDTNTTTNPPIVNLISPIKDTVFTSGDKIQLTASVTTVDSPINRVEFYAYNTKIGESFSSPYTAIWTPSIGTYILYAKAIDTSGLYSYSSDVGILVNNGYGYCGDGTCSSSERCDVCMADCGVCIFNPTVELFVESIASTVIGDNDIYAIIDKSLATGWRSQDVQITLDLGDLYALDSLRISFTNWNTTSYDYIVSISKDASNWTVVSPLKDSFFTKWNTIQIDEASARFIKIESLGVIAIDEVEVRGTYE